MSRRRERRCVGRRAMAEWGGARGRAETWPSTGAVARRPARLPWRRGIAEASRAAAHDIRRWLVVEVAPGRLGTWLPLAFGIGAIDFD